MDKIVLHSPNLTNSVILHSLHNRIARREDKTHTNLHSFSTYFYSLMVQREAARMTRWTKRKNVNIFEKKIIFIPIHADSHWSLCIILNPGSIKNSFESDGGEQANENLIPCLIHLDSYGTHNGETIRNQLLEWLNLEYYTSHPDEPRQKLFNQDTFKLFTPTGTCSFLLPWLLFRFQPSYFVFLNGAASSHAKQPI